MKERAGFGDDVAVAVWFGELDEPHTKASCGCVRSTPSWSGSRTSTSHGDPALSEASRRRSVSRRVAGNEHPLLDRGTVGDAGGDQRLLDRPRRTLRGPRHFQIIAAWGA